MLSFSSTCVHLPILEDLRYICSSDVFLQVPLSFPQWSVKQVHIINYPPSEHHQGYANSSTLCECPICLACFCTSLKARTSIRTFSNFQGVIFLSNCAPHYSLPGFQKLARREGNSQTNNQICGCLPQYLRLICHHMQQQIVIITSRIVLLYMSGM